MLRNFSFTTALICLNGHVLSDSVDDRCRVNHCSICGAEAISACPSCGADIHGYYDGASINKWKCDPVPLYCHNCGSPYPWTDSTITAFNDIIDLEEKLTDDEKAALKTCFPDILRNTPRSAVASLKLHQYLKSAGSQTMQALKSALAGKVVNELLKSLLGW